MARVNGFPDSWGNKRVSVFTVTGPTSYTQYSAPATGGQVVQALPESGVKQVDFAEGSVSLDGTHRVEVVQIEPSVVGGVTLGDTQLRLKWYVLSSGAQAASMANLSGQTARVRVVGDK